ncbi:TetR/AcrR family transcriptional regulator [Quadrisphaera sp. KR29]|uniref:TetR/AcrR family transcriptional regulator n=1 Tax=Quadrisphaera sp. KR29 TaxID=3461391 RepID=UPI004044AD40
MDSASPLRRRAPRQDAARNRERLLRAARTVFAEQGPEAPLEEVAKLANVSRTTLYRNFASREELASVIYAEGMVAVEAKASAVADEPLGALALVDFVLQLQIDHRVTAPALTPAGDGHYADYAERTQQALRPAVAMAMTHQVLREGVDLLDVLLALRMAEVNALEADAQTRAIHHQRGRHLVMNALFTEAAVRAFNERGPAAEVD